VIKDGKLTHNRLIGSCEARDRLSFSHLRRVHAGRKADLRTSERFLIIGMRSLMRFGRTPIVGAVIAATTAGTMLVAAPGAMAAPGSCTISYPTANTVTSLCTSGTGHQQIVVEMYQGNAGNNAVAGNWAAVGQVSTVYVPWTIVSAWVNLSNS
jgi:hypothetical protein